MTSWVENPKDHMWLLWEEELRPDAWLVCFKPAADSDDDTYWLSIMPVRWSTTDGNWWHNGHAIEEHSFKDPLMHLCFMHEMRDKYRDRA